MDQQSKLTDFRKKYMEDRKVVCTGNPNNPYSIAYGVKNYFPNAQFLSKSTGWDLTDPANKDRILEEFKKYNTFINASYIAPGAQSTLLDLCNQAVKFCDVINIGSTNEYDEQGSPEYTKSKIDLRTNSLRLNTFRFSTTHILMGKIKKFDNDTGFSSDQIGNIILWILSQDYKIPMIALDHGKQAW